MDKCCEDEDNREIDYSRREYTYNGEELNSFVIMCKVCGEDIE